MSYSDILTFLNPNRSYPRLDRDARLVALAGRDIDFATSMRRRCSGPLQVRRSNGQLADALACRGVNRIAKRRRDWGHAGPHRRRPAAPRSDDIHVCLRRDVHARHQIIGEVGLLDLADRYATIRRIAEAHQCGPLHLCAHSIGIHGQAAIDGHIDAWNRNLSVIRDGDLDHRRDVGNELRWRGMPRP
jgi:hypothetical protein